MPRGVAAGKLVVRKWGAMQLDVQGARNLSQILRSAGNGVIGGEGAWALLGHGR